MKKKDPNALVKKVRNSFIAFVMVFAPLICMATKWRETFGSNVPEIIIAIAVILVAVILVIVSRVAGYKLGKETMNTIVRTAQNYQKDSNTSGKVE